MKTDFNSVRCKCKAYYYIFIPELSHENNKKIQDLIESTRSHLDEANYHSFNISWRNGVDPNDAEHKKYLENLGNLFATHIQRLVEKVHNL